MNLLSFFGKNCRLFVYHVNHKKRNRTNPHNKPPSPKIMCFFSFFYFFSFKEWLIIHLTRSYILPQKDPFLSGNYRPFFRIQVYWVSHCAITVLKKWLLRMSSLDDGADCSGKQAKDIAALEEFFWWWSEISRKELLCCYWLILLHGQTEATWFLHKLVMWGVAKWRFLFDMENTRACH